MDIEGIRATIVSVRRQTTNREVLVVCDFAEKCLGSKPKMSEVERRERTRLRVRAWRERARGVGKEVREEEDGSNPFE